MASYNNQYAAKINVTPANPNLRGIEDNYSNNGQTNLGGYGLGDIYQLDYDRNKIEQIFNQGTDAQYALMQKEAQVAENNYANQQFQNQFNTMEALRAQRNEQIASGMARGLNAASDQATALGIQQEAMSGALELAQNRQMQADQIAAEYAQNVAKALQEANSVKQAMAQVAAQLYEADMLGYTGELSALGTLDANESNRYGYELGLEGTQYQANKNLEGAKYTADRNLEGTKYAADKTYAGYLAQANATRYAADVSAAAQREANSKGVDINYMVETYKDSPTKLKQELAANGVNVTDEEAQKLTNDYWAVQMGYTNYSDLQKNITNRFNVDKNSADKLSQNAIKYYQTNGSFNINDGGRNIGYDLGDALNGVLSNTLITNLFHPRY